MTRLKPDTIERQYWTMADAAEALGVTTATIRLYEKTFGLVIGRNRRGDRKLTADQIGQLAIVLRLGVHLKVKSAVELYREGKAEAFLDLKEPKIADPIGVPMKIA